MEIHCAHTEVVDISTLVPNPNNPNKHPQEQLKLLAKILKHQGWRNPIVVSKRSGFMTKGHGRLEAAKLNGWEKVPIDRQDYANEADEYADMVADNKIAELANSDDEMIKSIARGMPEDFDLDLLGIPDFSLDDPSEAAPGDAGKQKLSDRFLVPPFSVLDARQGYWTERKREWLDMGIKSEVGRGQNLLGMSDTMLQPDPEKRKKFARAYGTEGNIAGEQTGTSIFDPVLCELAYRWFSPKAGTVLDPFAGGSVRGIVCSKLGRQYIGCELRQEQVEANREQATDLCDDPMPVWHCGDSQEIQTHAKGVQADLLFSCPPYADLEVYSEDPRDISNMPYDGFLKAYRNIIAQSAGLLKEDRFAVWVIGEVRDKKGIYLGFVQDTIRAFEDAGLRFYNEAVLVTSVGTLALRAAKMMTASRKLGKTHQNVLVFVKGDPKKATQACGEIEIADLSEHVQAEESEYGEEL